MKKHLDRAKQKLQKEIAEKLPSVLLYKDREDFKAMLREAFPERSEDELEDLARLYDAAQREKRGL